MLEYIDAESFDSIDEEQLSKFSNALNSMPKDVAIKCIEQFPDFSAFATNLVNNLKSNVDSLIQDNNESRKDTLESYKRWVDLLADLAARPDLDEEKRLTFIEQGIEVSDKIAQLHKENQSFLLKTFGIAATAGIAVLTALLAFFNNAGKSDDDDVYYTDNEDDYSED